MSDSPSGGAYTLGVSKTADALDKAAETAQLDERNIGVTLGDGISPPYPPENLAVLLELNGTHAVCVGKKASREVGFGFDIVPHPGVDEPEEAQREIVDEFWRSPDSIWKVGPKGTPTTSPTEVFEQARQDYHSIGWLDIELIYGADDQPHGLAHLPARTVRVRKDREDGDRVAGHGYVQEIDGQTKYFAEAGDRQKDTYVDEETGEVFEGERPPNPANEILHIINPHPNALYYGLPDWIAEVETMIGDHEARRYNREYFEWDAMGQYFILVEGGKLTEESREHVRNLIQGLREREGRRVAVLEAEEIADRDDISFESQSTSSPTIKIEPVQTHGEQDEAFTQYRSRNEHDIAKVHEVPPQLLGDMEDSNRSNIKEAVRDFTKEVIEPQQEKFAGRLYRILHQKILGVTDWTIEFETRGAENEREEAEVASIIIDSIGDGMTVREAREQHGLEPQPEWMSDAVANSLLSEIQNSQSPGEALDVALSDTEEEAAARARTEARIQAGAAEAD